MLRALFVGVLAVFAAASCKSKADAPAVAVGTAAGKVVELTGKVSATREGKTRELAMGGEVFADDQIATAADANVTIELFHNGAKWAVVSNKTARVDSSLAWGLDKQQASSAVDHNSAAAGRNAERSAADTASTTDLKQAPMRAAEQPTAAAAPPAQAAPPVGGAAPGAANAEPPPPPPPPPPPAIERAKKGTTASAPRRMAEEKELADEAVENKKEAPKLDPAPKDAVPEKAAVVIKPQQVAEHHRAEFAACLDPKASKLVITISVRKNKATTTLTGPGNRSAKIKACVDGVAQKIEWPIPGATFEVKLVFD